MYFGKKKGPEDFSSGPCSAPAAPGSLRLDLRRTGFAARGRRFSDAILVSGSAGAPVFGDSVHRDVLCLYPKSVTMPRRLYQYGLLALHLSLWEYRSGPLAGCLPAL